MVICKDERWKNIIGTDQSENEERRKLVLLRGCKVAGGNQKSKKHFLEQNLDQEKAICGPCAICWCPYQEGEVACVSSNRMCRHAYHTDCIMPWFIERKRNDCPLCRRNFLKGFL